MRFAGYVLKTTCSGDQRRDKTLSVCGSNVLKHVFTLEHVNQNYKNTMIYNLLRFKQVARKVCIRKREYSLSSNEQVLARKYRKLITNLCLQSKLPGADIIRCRQVAKCLVSRYYKLVLGPKITLGRPPRLRYSIDSFSSNDCYNFFEFKKDDLPRLLAGLQFPERCKLDGGSLMSGEEVLLRGLYELVSGEDQHNISRNVFGREQTA